MVVSVRIWGVGVEQEGARRRDDLVYDICAYVVLLDWEEGDGEGGKNCETTRRGRFKECLDRRGIPSVIAVSLERPG